MCRHHAAPSEIRGRFPSTYLRDCGSAETIYPMNQSIQRIWSSESAVHPVVAREMGVALCAQRACERQRSCPLYRVAMLQRSHYLRQRSMSRDAMTKAAAPSGYKQLHFGRMPPIVFNELLFGHEPVQYIVRHAKEKLASAPIYG